MPVAKPLPEELAAAEAEGSSFTTDDVRRHARDHLDRLSLTPTRIRPAAAALRGLRFSVKSWD